jgi:hypothetical protein
MGSLLPAQALFGFLNAAMVLAPVGEEVQIQMSAKQRIREAYSRNDRVALPVHPPMPSPFSVHVKGQSPGLNPLVLTDEKGKSQFFLVVVPKPNR